ncbi:hypothetical protein MNBD_GAMMA18-1060 [hydrothermal vent metagenome]|uniref:CBM11 domain-containing protein n=1 Tax=hydrothermal vent metagenome TaxID=652676 RepID=A0A3B0ZUS4_9ZZZZ
MIKKQLPLFFILAMLVLALVPINVGGYQQLTGQLMDLGHFFAFAVMALLLRYQWHRLGMRRSLSLALGLSVLGAILLELVQPWFDRQLAWSDFINSVLGAFLALLGYWLWYCQPRYSPRVMHGILTLLLLIWIAMPTLMSLYGIWWKQSHFPQLADFESEVELQLWQAYGEANGIQTHASFSTQGRTSGCCSLKVVSVSGVWSGLRYHAEGMDWQGYNRIAVDVYNPGEAFSLRFRLDDGRPQEGPAQRYEGALHIRPGMNLLSVDFSTISQAVSGKPFDFGSINMVLFYIARNDRSRLFYIDNIRLLR